LAGAAGGDTTGGTTVEMVGPVVVEEASGTVVGVVTGGVTTVLFGMLSIYVASLKRAMREIKTLEGLLPICSSCNKIRTPDNQWHVLEKYISARTEATFTHSVCPECARRLYPQMYPPAQ